MNYIILFKLFESLLYNSINRKVNSRIIKEGGSKLSNITKAKTEAACTEAKVRSKLL